MQWSLWAGLHSTDWRVHAWCTHTYARRVLQAHTYRVNAVKGGKGAVAMTSWGSGVSGAALKRTLLPRSYAMDGTAAAGCNLPMHPLRFLFLSFFSFVLLSSPNPWRLSVRRPGAVSNIEHFSLYYISCAAKCGDWNTRIKPLGMKRLAMTDIQSDIALEHENFSWWVAILD